MEEFRIMDIAYQLLADCQSGFFFYTLVYFALRISKGKQKLDKFDWCATMVICVISPAYFVVWTAEWLHIFSTSDETRASVSRRLSGQYSFSLWLPPIFYFVLPQFLWIRKVRDNYLSRFVIAFLVFFNFEKFVIIVTSLHRDYLPSSWTMGSDALLPGLAYGIASKFVLFTGLAALLFSVRRKRDNFAP